MKFWKCFALIYCSLLLVACGENAADISAKKAAAEVKKADAEVKKAEDERKKIEAAAKEIEEEVKQGVRSSLKDPDSAKFGTFNLVGADGACITVNARNSFGGYVGDKDAYLIKSATGKWQTFGITDRGLDFCKMMVKAYQPKG